MNKINKRIISMLMLLVMVVALIVPSKIAEANVADTSLITSVTNTANGRLTIKFQVPAGKTINYSVYPNIKVNGEQQGQTLQHVVGSYTNTTDETAYITKIVAISYYGNYIAYVTCGKLYDEHTVASKLLAPKKSAKFVWNEEDISNLANDKTVNAFKTKVFDIGISKAPDNAINVSESVTYVGLFGSINIASEKQIPTKPAANYEYQLLYYPTSGGIDVFLACYNTNGTCVCYTKINSVTYSNSGYILKVL